VATTGLTERVRSVPRPPAVLERDREAALSERQRELLDVLVLIFDKGFVHLTMADLARELNCSLRTLYGLAPSRNELVLLVVDRNLRSIGRSANDCIDPAMSAIEAVRAYLQGATEAVSATTEEFAADMVVIEGGPELGARHSEYLVAVTRAILDFGVDSGEICDVDTAAAARVMAGLGREFARPEVIPKLRTNPKKAADAMVEIVLAGLTSAPAGCAFSTPTTKDQAQS